MSDTKFIASRLAAKMKEKGFSDQKLGDAVGMSRTAVYYLRVGREGESVATSGENLAKIASVLNTSIEFFVNEDADPSPNQKKMSALVADIASIAEDLSPTDQRRLREMGTALAKMKESTDVDAIYGELMELATRLTELKGGKAALNDLITHVNELVSRPSPASMKGSARGRTASKRDAKSTDEKTKSSD